MKQAKKQAIGKPEKNFLRKKYIVGFTCSEYELRNKVNEKLKILPISK